MKVNFYVNKDKRMVVCVLSRCENDCVSFMRHNSGFDPDSISKTNNGVWIDRAVLADTGKMPSRFVGKAVCSEEDEWDESVGRAIAYSRARKNYDRSFFRHANAIVTTIDKYLGELVDVFNAYGDKIAAAEESRDARIEKLMPKS